jgi:hypothetical protein
MSKKRKHISFSLKEKLELLKRIDKGESGLEELERALLYVEQHSKATPTDVIFKKLWRDSLFSSFNALSEENNGFCKKGQFINMYVIVFCQFSSR